MSLNLFTYDLPVVFFDLNEHSISSAINGCIHTQVMFVFFKKNRIIKKGFDYSTGSEINNLTPWIIRLTPIRIAAKSGLVSDNPPRANAIIPKIIINIEAIFEMPSPEKRPAIPNKIIKIPIM